MTDGARLTAERTPETELDYGSTTQQSSYTVQEALDHSGLGLGNLLAIGCAFLANFAEGIELVILVGFLTSLQTFFICLHCDCKYLKFSNS